MKTKDIVTGIIKHSKISVYLYIQLGSISVWALMAAARFKVGHFLREQHKEKTHRTLTKYVISEILFVCVSQSVR